MEIAWDIVLLGMLVGLVAGAIAGTLAGLAGVGGGLIYVPVFYATMPDHGGTLAAHVFGSMVAIVLTGYFSARSHWQLGHVSRAGLGRLLPGLVIGAALGLWLSLRLPEQWVLLGLGLLDAWIAWDYGRRARISQQGMPLMVASAPIGYLSGSLGIGGGTMLVPLLRRHLTLREAVGTSAAAGFLMATGAVTANLLFEPGWLDVLQNSLPFLAGAWLGILIVLPKTSGWAAHLHATIAEERIRRYLKLLFVLLSASLLLEAWVA